MDIEARQMLISRSDSPRSVHSLGWRGVVRALMVALAVVLPGLRSSGQTRDASGAAQPPVLGTHQHLGLPLIFVENRGQWDAAIPFASRFGRGLVRPLVGGLSVVVGQRDQDRTERSHVVQMSWGGTVDPDGIEPLPGAFHFLLGRDPSGWQRSVPGFAGVRYQDVQPGLDLELRGADGGFAMTLRGETAAAVGAFRLHVSGVGAPEARSGGGIVLRTSLTDIVLLPPVVRRGGEDLLQLEARWRVEGPRLALELPPAAEGPGSLEVVWSTFLGGSQSEHITDVALAPAGLVTVVGKTKSPDFPTTPGAFQETDASTPTWDSGFVTRLDPATQQLVFSTYLGGSPGPDRIFCMQPVGQGDVLIAGETGNANFPVTGNAFDQTFNPGSEAFVARLSSDGSDLVFSTFLGGQDPLQDTPRALAVEPTGIITVAGFTSSKDFPTTPGAFQPLPSDKASNQGDGFITKIDPLGSTILYSTYLGGGPNHPDILTGAVIDELGAVIVTGYTTSAEFPVTPNAFNPTYQGSWDGFVARLSPDLSTLEWSTYFGSPQLDRAWAVALGPGGSVVVAGETEPPGFPVTADAFDPVGQSDEEAFVIRFDPTGSRVVYATYLGGTGREGGPCKVAVDSAGAITVIGQTWSFSFPVTPGAFQLTKANPGTDHDGFVTRFHPDGQSLLYSTFLGGSLVESPSNSFMALDTDVYGGALVGQWTASADFPVTAGAFDTMIGGSDGALTFLTMLPTGVNRYGTSTPGPAGPLAIGVLSRPHIGNTRFGITATNAPPVSTGYLAVSTAGLATSLPLAGAAAWIDPAGLVAIVPVVSNGLGWSELLLPIPADPLLAGWQAYAQSFWPLTSARNLAASNALSIVIQ